MSPIFIHGHCHIHNLIDYSRVYSTNSYSQLLWSHLLNPVIAVDSRTPSQHKLYTEFEHTLLHWPIYEANNLPFLMHTEYHTSQAEQDIFHSKRDSNWNYADYKDQLESSQSIAWAVHPFTKQQSGQYDHVCEEFGYQLPQVEHHWNTLDASQLWTVVGQFNWKQHIHNGYGDDVKNDLGCWYADIFHSYATLDEYHKHIGLE